jgi:biopolymer transport protein ExbD
MTVAATGSDQVINDLNTTPLIDVMLVLLIMLIVTLPAQRHAVKLDTPLPCETCPQPTDPPAPIRITVDHRGAISWNDDELSRADLERRLAVEAKRSQQADLHIRADSDAEYGAVAHVLAAAQRQGIRRMGLVGG